MIKPQRPAALQPKNARSRFKEILMENTPLRAHRTPISAVVEAQIQTDTASVKIIRLDWHQNAELVVAPLNHFQLDYCLSARLHGMSVCYPQHWGAMHYERVGELMLIPPGEKLSARCEFPEGIGQYSHTSTVIQLQPELVYEWFDGAPQWGQDRLEAGLDIGDQTIGQLVLRATRETLNPTRSSHKLIELITSELGIEVGRYFARQTAPEFKGGLAAWRLRLIEQLAQQSGKSPSLAEIAERCNISTRQLQRGFRVSRGSSIGSYLEYCRIENAKRLLQKGIASKDVASTLGYSSHSSFSYAFRRATGGTPAQFCKLI